MKKLIITVISILALFSLTGCFNEQEVETESKILCEIILPSEEVIESYDVIIPEDATAIEMYYILLDYAEFIEDNLELGVCHEIDVVLDE